MIVRELITALGFEVDDAKLKNFEAGVERVKKGMIGLSAVTAGAAALVYGFVKTSADTADHLFKLAGAAGVSVEDLQRLGHAAAVSGSDVEELAQGLKFLSRNLYDAAKQPTGEAAKAFQSLGIKTKDSTGKLRNTSDVVAEVSDRFSKLPNRAAKAALAMQLFGRGGGDLVEFLDQGSAKIRELSGELDAFGGVLSEGQVRDLKDFNDALTRVWGILSALKNVVAAELAPDLIGVVDSFRKFLIVNKDIIKSNLLGFMRALSGFVVTMWKTVRVLGGAFAFLAEHLGGTEKITKALLYVFTLLSAATVLAGIFNLIKAFQALGVAINVAFLKPTLIAAAIVAAAALIFLVVEDIVSYFQGKKSLTGEFFEKISSVLDSVKAKLQAFADWLNKDGGLFGKLADLSFLPPKVKDELTWLEGIVTRIRDAIKDITTLGGVLPKDFFNFGLNPSTMHLKDKAAPGESTTPGLDFIKSLFGGSSDSAAPPSGIAPGSLPSSGVNTSQIIINSPINVTVPAGTSPGAVGDRVQIGVTDAVAGMLRQAHRATS